MIYRPHQFNEQQRLRSAIILDAIEQLDGLIQANSPKGAQQTLALRHLEDVAMRVNKAISEESFDAIITYTEPCPPRSSVAGDVGVGMWVPELDILGRKKPGILE